MSVLIGIVGNSFAEVVPLPALRSANVNGAPNAVVAIAGPDAVYAIDVIDAARASSREKREIEVRG